METSKPTNPELGDRADSAQSATLPYEKAFVVQFTAETGSSLTPAAGRVEHLLTGRRSRFASIEEFLDCLARLLVDEAKAAPKRGRRAGRKGSS